MSESMGDSDDPRVARVRRAMDEKGWTQRLLADKSLTGESTVFRLLRGQYTRKTMVKIERALEISTPTMSESGDTPPGVATPTLGSYARLHYAHYEGTYCCLRLGFSDTDKLVAYRFEVRWSDEDGGLVFEDGNPGYEQEGRLLVPPGTPFVHFLTLDQGSARLITAYHMPPGQSLMRGLVMSIANPQGRQLFPAAAPLLLVHLGDGPHPLAGLTGVLTRDEPRLRDYFPILDEMDVQPMLLRG